MYACICNAIREKDLRRLAAELSGDAEALYAVLGHQPQCRQCLDDANDTIADVRAERCCLPGALRAEALFGVS